MTPEMIITSPKVAQKYGAFLTNHANDTNVTPKAGLEGPAKEIIVVPEEQPSIPDTVPDSFPDEAPVDPMRQPEEVPA